MASSLTVTGWLLLFTAFSAAPTPKIDPAEAPYMRGLSLFRQKKFDAAREAFTQTFTLLKARKPEAGRKAHLLTLGRCDLLYFLAKIDHIQKKPRASCRNLAKLTEMLRTVPDGWKQWRINRLLPGRFEEAATLFEGCAQVPSILKLETTPKDATIALLDAKTKAWTPAQSPISTTQTSLTLRIQAKGFLDKTIQQHKVIRWKTQTLTVALKAKPKVVERRLVAVVTPPERRKPPPPTPWYRSPWVWVGVGAVVAAGAGVGIYAATRPRNRMSFVVVSNTP